MSKYTPSLPYTEKEFADMIQCYLDSGKDVVLTQMYYVTRYPNRRKPKLYTIEKIVQKYLKTLSSVSTPNCDKEVPNPDKIKDDRIVTYFKNNSHASVKKAASIFNVKSSYVYNLIEEKKDEIEAKKNEDNNKKKQKLSLNDFIRKQKKIEPPETKVKKEENESESEEETIQTVNEFDIKLEIEDHKIDMGEYGIKLEKCDSNEQYDAPEIKVEIGKSSVDNICNENENETNDRNKRKVKEELPVVSKKLRTLSKQDLNEKEIAPIYNPIVYTKRLEEMLILHEKIKYLDPLHVWKVILRESKPKFTHSVPRLGMKIKKTMSLKMLKTKLILLNKKTQVIDFTKDDPIKTKRRPKKSLLPADKPVVKPPLPIVESDNKSAVQMFKIDDYSLNKTCNVVVIINNLYSKVRDIYVTDSFGSVIEYYCTKLDDEFILSCVDPSKVRLTLEACCWFHRRHKTESIWSRNETPISRFLLTMHLCKPECCTCCCKLKDPVAKPIIIDSYYRNTFVDTDLDGSQKSLIAKSLIYKVPTKIKNDDSFRLQILDNSPRRFVIMESPQTMQQRNMIFDYCELGRKKDIIFHSVVYSPDNRLGEFKCMFSFKDALRFNFCCNFKRNALFRSEYKDGQMSANTIRFLKKKIHPNICVKCSKEKEYKIVINPVKIGPFVPSIEHTRKLFKSTLLKLGFRGNISNSIDTNTIQRETVQLVISCEQIPGTEFVVKNVDHQTATGIVMKLTVMRFTIKEDGKVVASLNSPMQTTYTEEFQVIATVLQNIQSHLKDTVLPLGSAIILVAKIKAEDIKMIQVSSNASNNIRTYQNVFQDAVGTSIVANNETNVQPKKSSSFTNTKNAPNKLNPSNFTNFESNCLNVGNKNIDQNNELEKVCGSYRNLKNRDNVIHKNVILKKLLDGKKPTKKIKIEDKNPDTSKGIKNKVETSRKSDIYGWLADILSCSKQCYADSFKSYLKAKTTVPKICSVFSLHQPEKQLIQPNNTAASATSLNNLVTLNGCVPSTSSNIAPNVSNTTSPLIVASVSPQVLLYNPATNVIQVVNLNVLVCDPLSTVTGNTVPTEPIAIDNNNDNAVLTPLNEISILKMPKENAILPDLVSYIPKYDTKSISDYAIVKEEKDEEIVILDSD